MNVTVNGEYLPHGVGDPYFYVRFKSDTGEPVIERKEIERITIDKKKTTYFDEDNYLLTADNMSSICAFWEREDAEKWLSDHFNGLKFEPEDTFYIIENGSIVPIRLRESDFITILDGQIWYEFEISVRSFGAAGPRYIFVNHDTGLRRNVLGWSDPIKNCPAVFPSYEDAKKWLTV